MAIKIKTAPPADPTPTPHEEAAADLALTGAPETTTENVDKVTVSDGIETKEVVSEDSSVDIVQVPALHDTVTVGMGFKMPIAEFTMVSYFIQRATPCANEDADAVYEANKAWVEDRLNELVSEQQAAQ